MNDIKDYYVTEYVEKVRTIKAKAFHHFHTWSIVAACLALVIICTPALIHIFLIFRKSTIPDLEHGMNLAVIPNFAVFCRKETLSQISLTAKKQIYSPNLALF